MYEVLDKIINEIDRRLTELNIKIKLSKKAKDYFIENGYDEYFGARPLKRLINRELETKLDKLLIENKIKPNKEVNIDIEKEELTITQEV